MNAGRPDGAGTPEAHARLLDRFRSGHPEHGRRLGSGGEATVYALDRDRVLRILRTAQATPALERAYQRWSSPRFALPEIIDAGVDQGTRWQLMRRIPGQKVSSWLGHLHGDERARLLQRYVDAAFEISSIASASAYGPLLGSTTYATWGQCLAARLQRPDPALRARLAHAVPGLPALIEPPRASGCAEPGRVGLPTTPLRYPT